jgi:hypothetical protein
VEQVSVESVHSPFPVKKSRNGVIIINNKQKIAINIIVGNN